MARARRVSLPDEVSSKMTASSTASCPSAISTSDSIGGRRVSSCACRNLVITFLSRSPNTTTAAAVPNAMIESDKVSLSGESETSQLTAAAGGGDGVKAARGNAGGGSTCSNSMNGGGGGDGGRGGGGGSGSGLGDGGRLHHQHGAGGAAARLESASIGQSCGSPGEASDE
eukprot:scaffold4063_cov119-Isochrysis_galbana.AAC.2